MDILSGLNTAYNVGSEMLGDYQRGKEARLGSYKGSNDVKKIGHYNIKGKRLGIYHG